MQKSILHLEDIFSLYCTGRMTAVNPECCSEKFLSVIFMLRGQNKDRKAGKCPNKTSMQLSKSSHQEFSNPRRHIWIYEFKCSHCEQITVRRTTKDTSPWVGMNATFWNSNLPFLKRHHEETEERHDLKLWHCNGLQPRQRFRRAYHLFLTHLRTNNYTVFLEDWQKELQSLKGKRWRRIMLLFRYSAGNTLGYRQIVKR